MAFASDEPLGAIERLHAALTKLPGIGPKSADRLVHFLLSGDRTATVEIAEAIRGVLEFVKPCRECFNLCEGDLCPICSDPRRDASILCVVETPRDVGLFERTGHYRGLYHVLGGRLAPLENIGPDKLSIAPLAHRVRRGGVREVILATSPTFEGDGTALLVSNVLSGSGASITRLARGIPSGASLELINPQILSDALEDRRTY
ncbi:recombination mediator RecR [soil metagenome]